MASECSERDKRFQVQLTLTCVSSANKGNIPPFDVLKCSLLQFTGQSMRAYDMANTVQDASRNVYMTSSLQGVCFLDIIKQGVLNTTGRAG